MIASDVLTQVTVNSDRLRELVHADKILIMPGAYDALSARLFEHLGFEAIQGSSGAVAFGLGYQDGEAISRDEMIEVSGRIAAAIAVPFNADGERGYGNADGIKKTAQGLIAKGVAGMNLEDSAPRSSRESLNLVAVEAYLDKIQALHEVKQMLGCGFFINARVDALMVMRDDPQAALREAIKRGQAYAEAGSDCIFFINAHTPDVIARLVKEIPAPVSVLAGPQTPAAPRLQELGVARVSYGSAFSAMAAGAMRRFAQELLNHGTTNSLVDRMPVQELGRIMRASS